MGAHMCVHVCSLHMCVCVHTCVCGCTHACVCMSMCAQMDVHTCVFIACVCMHAWGGVHVHVSVHMCVDRCACVCVHCMCVHMYVWGVCKCVWMGVCMWMGVRTCVCSLHLCVHVCVCTHLCVSALSGAHKMEPYCQNNAILTTGISKGIRSSNSVTCRETLSRSRIKYTMSPGSLQATRQNELPASQRRWPSRRHSRSLPSVDQPVNPSSFHRFVCFSCEGK